MKEVYKNIPLVNNEAEKRFEIEIDGSFAFINYKELDGKIALIHTETDPALAGQGAASAVVEKTLHYIKEHDQQVLPVCSYVFAILKKHPEWKHMVDKGFNGYDKL